MAKAKNPFWVRSILLLAHPVGSYYWSSDSTSPAMLFGGTWERIKDKFVLAAGDTYEAGATGGEENHTLLESELPNVQGDFGCFVPGGHDDWRNGVFQAKNLGHSGNQAPNGGVGSGEVYGYGVDLGENQPHNNMPPYIAAYCWRRTV